MQLKRTKFRKQMTGHNCSLTHRSSKVSFGEYALKATSRGRLAARQIESARRALTHHVGRGGKIWVRVSPEKPVTKRPLEVHMDKGRGGVECWVAQIQPGKVLYEIEGVPEELAHEASALVVAELPLAIFFVKRTVMR